MARRTDPEAGLQAVRAWQSGDADSKAVRTAVRYTLELLAAEHPGHSVEVRVPPAGVVQAVRGPRHTRGTPPNVVETDPQTWLALAVGQLTWDGAVESGAVNASGQRGSLAEFLPLLASRS